MISLIILFVWPCFLWRELILLTSSLYPRTFRNCLNNLYFRRVKNFFPYVVKLELRPFSKDFYYFLSWSYSLMYLSDEHIFRLLRWNNFINFVGLQSLTWSRKWQPTPVLLPKESRGQRAWWAAVHGVTESQTRLKQLSMHAWIGEGNGNPLQCSSLENPRDRGAWWAAIYGVTQSRTRLNRLSSSSSV